MEFVARLDELVLRLECVGIGLEYTIPSPTKRVSCLSLVLNN